MNHSARHYKFVGNSCFMFCITVFLKEHFDDDDDRITEVG